jgi:hypothetical protein
MTGASSSEFECRGFEIPAPALAMTAERHGEERSDEAISTLASPR